MPAVARLSGVTPGISGYSNMPTLETHAVRSSGERATAKGCLPTRTDWRTVAARHVHGDQPEVELVDGNDACDRRA